MKVSGLCVLFLVLGTAFLFLNFSSEMVFAQHVGGDAMPMTTASRRLKENGHNSRSEKKRGQIGDVNLGDYHPIDPVPSSKASFKHGPIEHGTPLVPHIPRPSPPTHPENGGFA
ncbi:uncharacterized protein LOC122318264 isoform X2 [Carya illinoinensis]|uniref:Uncharacterized protein n=1 Tax=Carya illinoinensis TaxID=32201 RepID=A0A8T1PIU1_CARIL|nr:uncharacterized protein LOC122318264 isoform X2 [Carya illinoinensis]KAG6644339.1 hypothetical protein CIPAW_08G049000 [Carya illinoinensis]